MQRNLYNSISRISAFISYSSEDKITGGKLKEYLINYCGYYTFIAHEDIPASTIWEEEIVQALESADFVIPLISEGFKHSNFTDQEIGIATYLKKKIVPVKLGVLNPYGFISKYQALQYKTFSPRSDNMKELALTIAQVGLHYSPESIYYEKTLQSIVYAFRNAPSFEAANATIQLICKCNDLTSIQLAQISTAVKNNIQITGAYGLPILKDFLKKSYSISID